MMQLLIYAGHWVGGTMVLFGAWIVAQTTLDNAERFLGGSIILIVGGFIIRWVLKASERVEATWSGAIEKAEAAAEKAEDRADAADARCAAYQKEIDAIEAKYDEERKLRISLEERG